MNTERIILLCTVGLILIGAAILLLGILRKNGTKTTESHTPPIPQEKTEEVLLSPLSGIVIPLEQIQDDVFSAGVLGKGTAIIPKIGELYSPADGVVSGIPESKHAIALTTNSGIELLIHVGIDTVNLKGEYFFPQVKTGDRVRAGQLLLSFTLDKIKEVGYDPVTPLILTEADGWNISPIKGDIRAGDILMSLQQEQK